jgi:hypothetical protein
VGEQGGILIRREALLQSEIGSRKFREPRASRYAEPISLGFLLAQSWKNPFTGLPQEPYARRLPPFWEPSSFLQTIEGAANVQFVV